MTTALILVFSNDKSFNQDCETYKCATINKKGELSENFFLFKDELRKKILNGEAVHVFYRQGCRWDIGDQVKLTS